MPYGLPVGAGLLAKSWTRSFPYYKGIHKDEVLGSFSIKTLVINDLKRERARRLIAFITNATGL